MLPDARKLVHDMKQAAEKIVRFTSGVTIQRYEENEMLRSAVERQFEILGEALTRVKKVDPEILKHISEYQRIIRFRNVLIHGYDAITDSVVWDIVQNKLPTLRRELDLLPAN